MRFWWVNQNQTYRHEIDGGYLWSPKRRSDGVRNYFYETMKEVAPGDLVFSFADTFIKAIGIVSSYSYSSPKPTEFGSAGVNWSDWGWRVDVSYRVLINSIRPKDHMGLLNPTLPGKYSPLRGTGDGNQGVYLTEVPTAMAHVLVGLIGAEAQQILHEDAQLVAEGLVETGVAAQNEIQLTEEYEETQATEILANASLDVTERLALVRARRGQGRYREGVLELESACRITRVTNPTHLVARHIKPWRISNNVERLDGENGLLLTPSIDHLFGRGFISFSDSGNLICAPVADTESLKKMGIPVGEEVYTGAFTRKQQEYLEFHRDEILKRRAG